MTVYKISGNIEVVGANGRHNLSAREIVTPKTVLDLKYGSSVIIYDEANRKQFTLKTPGRATIATLLADKKTTVINLTERYLKYIKAQVFGNKAMVALNHSSDPATVTRDVDELLDDSLKRFATLQQKSSPFADEFNQFKENIRKQFDDFRRECADNYVNFARLAWEEMGLEPAVIMPRVPKTSPQNAPKLEEQKVSSTAVDVKAVFASKDIALQLQRSSDAGVATADVQPCPPVAVAERQNRGVDPLEVELFSTRFTLRYPAAVSRKLKLEECTENNVAELMELLMTEDYDNLLTDCLSMRDNRKLCDWAYYQLLKAVGQRLCPEDADAATVVAAFLFVESGYKMRMVIVDGHVSIFAASEQMLYRRCTLNIDGCTYVSLEPLDGVSSAFVCNAELYEDSKRMNMRVARQPLFDLHAASVRKVASDRYPEFALDVQVNQGLLDFYNSYPDAYVDGNFMSRWALYAEAPLAGDVEEQIYPAIRKMTDGQSKAEAVERILNWVQTGLVYKKDDDVWGRDRVFFSEESLHYPFCDCEDRAVLFSRVVRDILHLPCALIYYPAHLACAVQMDDADLPGDYLEIEGKRFIIADPAYIGARLGMTMGSKKGESVEVLLLQ